MHARPRRRPTAERTRARAQYAVECLHQRKGDAARLLAFAAFGALVGSVGGGFVRDALRGRSLLLVSVAVKVVGVASAGLWLLLDVSYPEQLTPFVLSAIVFAVLLAVDYSWNVLTSVFIMRFGGPTHCSTLLGLLDVLAFHVNIPFAFLAGTLMEEKDSASVLGIILGASVFAHGCMLAFLVLDLRFDGHPHQPLPAADSG